MKAYSEREDTRALLQLLTLSRKSVAASGTHPAREVIEELRVKLIDSRKTDRP